MTEQEQSVKTVAARKISRSQLKAYGTAILLRDQNRLCPLCLNPIDLKQAGGAKGHASSMVVDHCHDTGQIRGVLCRGCNGAEGKAMGAIATWGKAGFSPAAQLAYLKRLVAYLEKPLYTAIYPDHKTAEEVAAKAALKAKVAAARRRAVAKTKAAQ
jgi:hypothetical protein